MEQYGETCGTEGQKDVEKQQSSNKFNGQKDVTKIQQSQQVFYKNLVFLFFNSLNLFWIILGQSKLA